MLFALICTDKPDGLDLRMTTRPEHVAYLNDLNDRGVLKTAGPFLDDRDEPCGSLVVVEAENRDAAKMIADNDPYARAGLFAQVDIRAYNWSFNNPGA